MTTAGKGLLIALSLMLISSPGFSEKQTLRIGYFPNITHAQAVIGLSNGEFQKQLGSNVKVESKMFNAGPTAVEALMVNAVDLTYIGPNPAINGYVRSNGTGLKIIAGAASGGAALIVRRDAGINKISDFHGKKIATPQLGNTQDVALRNWLVKNGLKQVEKGGDVTVMPVRNPDQLALFLKKDIDAAWAVEPWASRLIHEGNGKLFIDERTLWPKGKFVTAHIIVSPAYLKAHPDITKKFLSAHVDLTQWINQHPAEAKKLVNQQLQKLAGEQLPQKVLDDAFGRLEITYDPIQDSLYQSADAAFGLGFLGSSKPNLNGIYDLSILNTVLKEKKLKAL